MGDSEVWKTIASLQGQMLSLTERVRELEDMVRELESGKGTPTAAQAAAPAPAAVAPVTPAKGAKTAKAPPAKPPEPEAEPVAGTPLDQHKADEKARILAALKKCNWNRVEAAASVGLPRRTFYRRMQEYKLQ